MIRLWAFLEEHGLQTLENRIKIQKLEEGLTKENFLNSAKQVYEIMFGEESDPIIFTGHKFFHTKVVKEPFTRPKLMEGGLHPFRMIFARYAESFRNRGNEIFDTEGVIQINDFLDSDHHKKVSEEIYDFPVCENIQPFNSMKGNLEAKDNHPPGLYKLLFQTSLYDRCVEAAHRNQQDEAAYEHFRHTTYIQRVRNQPGDGDIQKVCHSDVFYPCVKYWYFPEEVTIDDGPFLYAKNSVELTYDILSFHYKQSVDVVNNTWDQRRNKGHGEGSFRAIDNELEQMGLKLETITVKPNTLVIANTSGFHARGEATRSKVRNALHGAIRVETPFDTYG